jgi:ParB family chromosome partitioning protein
VALKRAVRTAAELRQQDECYTPVGFVVRALNVLGEIDLDPASCATANEVVRARRYYSVLRSGLSQRWRGRVWLNPPYSKPGPWAEKLLAHYQARDVRAAIALFNSRTSSSWFHLLAPHAWRCEPWRRIRFWGPSTKGGNGMQDQVFFYLGSDPERFAAWFGDVGRIVPPALKLRQGVTQGVTRCCVVCGRALLGQRADARTCSSPCRQRDYRRRRGAA